MKENIKAVWKDPVMSKVIAVGIIFIITLGYNKFQSYKQDVSFKESFYRFWNYSVQLWVIALISLIILILLWFNFIIKKSKKFEYDDDTITLDINLYLKIRDELLTDDLIMNIKQNVFSSVAFYSETLFKILDLTDESKKSYFEFLNPELENKKNQLITSISKLQLTTANYISAVHGTPGLLSIPREWAHNDKERFDKAWKDISLVENELAIKYDDFIKSGKRILKV